LKFVLLMQAFESGATKMLLGGVNGRDRQRKAIEDLGGDVLEQHVVLGSKDLVLTVDVPDEATMLAIQLAAEAGGMYVEPLRVCEEDQLTSAFEKFPELANLVRQETEDDA
jgi:uncharacterized protein with GYD domain